MCKKIFLVIGMHRSGTSLVTNFVSRFGLRLGDNLVASSSDNSDGFFEDATIVDCNMRIEKILARDHMHPTGILPFPDNWWLLDEIREVAQEIEQYLQFAIKDGDQPLLLKDPRLCRLLPLYSDIFKNLGVEPVIIFCFRNPSSVIRSKSQRDLISPSKIEVFLQLSLLDALAHLLEQQHSMLFVNYDDLLLDVEVFESRVRTFMEKHISISDNIELPEIRSDDISGKIAQDKAMFPTSDLTRGLASFLCDMSLDKELDASRFSAVKQEFDGMLKVAEPWLEGLQDGGDAINELADSVRSNERLSLKLKQSNKRIVSLQEEKHLLNKSYLSLKNKQNLKLFKLADQVYRIKNKSKEQIVNKLIFRSTRLLDDLKRYAVLFKRSANNNGVRYALKATAARLKMVLFSRKRAMLKRLKKAHALDRKAYQKVLNECDVQFTEGQKDILFHIFVADSYKQQAGLALEQSYEVAFKHFIEVGMTSGKSPGPMFNADTYIARSGNQNLDRDTAFLSWIDKGVENRVVPTVLFDEEFYLERYNINLLDNEWSFVRFIKNGIYNNATAHKYFEPNWYISHHELDDFKYPPFYHYLIEGYRRGWRPSTLFPAYSRSQCESMPLSPLEDVLIKTKMDEIVPRFNRNGILSQIIDRAAKIEPKIHRPLGHKRINIPPYNTIAFPAIQELRQALPENRYDTIVLIPHCRIGGAGLVAGELCNALSQINEQENVLLIRTDNDDFMRPDWFPETIDNINLLDFCPDVPDVHRKKVLLDLLIGLKPKRILNVHSRLGWIVFSEYGDRLKNWSSLYGYTFCYDVNFMGHKVGYPVKYVPATLQYLKALFVDNNYLKNDLIAVNQWSTSEAEKIKVLWTPPKIDEALETAIDSGSIIKLRKDRVSEQKKRVFWAGRFDRQKRFDLLVKIANKNPQYEFWVWGKAMLGDDIKTSKLPPNMLLKGLFGSYDEIPFEKCDAWLYTSQWDGVPTILIELGLRAIPVVASRVWGTSDVINEKTAWPVDDVANVVAYEQGLKFFIENPGEALVRGTNFQQHILKQHNRNDYMAAVNAEIEQDSWRAC